MAPPVRESPDPWSLILKAVSAIVAGVGALGFVTLAGGVILFERFDGVRLPAEHAVAVVPRSDLLVIGASVLLPLTAIIGVSLLLLWLVLAILGKWVDKWRIVVAASAAVVGTFIYFGLHADHFPDRGNALLLVIVVLGAVALGVLTWRALCKRVDAEVMSPSGRFGWFAIAAALLVFVAAGMVNWVLTREAPPVRPAVLVTKAHYVVPGLFIAETGSRVYLGEVDPSSDSHRGARLTGRMISFPSSDVLRLAVGSMQTLPSAEKQWSNLSAEVKASLSPGHPDKE